MNKKYICKEWASRPETNSGELYVELGAELTISDAIRRASLGLTFDLAPSRGDDGSDPSDSFDPTNVIGMDVDEAFVMARTASKWSKSTREEISRKKAEKAAKPVDSPPPSPLES